MNKPQATAKLISTFSNLEIITENSCCAFVYLWCLGIEPDDVHAIEIIDDAIRMKKLGSDCTVLWKDFGQWMTGRDIDVQFIDIKDLKGIIERTPVRYDYKGKSHWVGVEKGMIAFDPLGIGQSVCVAKGRPVSMRKITIKGVK